MPARCVILDPLGLSSFSRVLLRRSGDSRQGIILGLTCFLPCVCLSCTVLNICQLQQLQPSSWNWLCHWIRRVAAPCNGTRARFAVLLLFYDSFSNSADCVFNNILRTGAELRVVVSIYGLSSVLWGTRRRLHGWPVHFTDAGTRFHRRTIHRHLSPFPQGALLYA